MCYDISRSIAETEASCTEITHTTRNGVTALMANEEDRTPLEVVVTAAGLAGPKADHTATASAPSAAPAAA